jgi:hypothetical protein
VRFAVDPFPSLRVWCRGEIVLLPSLLSVVQLQSMFSECEKLCHMGSPSGQCAYFQVRSNGLVVLTISNEVVSCFLGIAFKNAFKKLEPSISCRCL